ncbi:MAG TPA: UrcA family protein [Steroidobacteraceae bacterium]|jgi:UrcA family protein|nr:UrcA family protein [Steroidobacteraceae bacterium]
MRTTIHSLFLLVLASVASSFAMADNVVTVKSETVRYDDLRLISAVGAAVLYGRLRGAAERACSPLDGKSAQLVSRYRACVDEAVAKAVAQVNEPVLTKYYESKRNAATPSTAKPSATAVAQAP